MLFLHGGADRPLAELQPHGLGRFLGIALGIGDVQLLGGLVEQVDREDAERRQPPDQLRDLRQQLLEVEDAADLAAEIGQRGQAFLGGGAGGGGRAVGRRVETSRGGLGHWRGVADLLPSAAT